MSKSRTVERSGGDTVKDSQAEGMAFPGGLKQKMKKPGTGGACSEQELLNSTSLIALDMGRERQESWSIRAWQAPDAWPHVSAWIRARSATGPFCLVLPFSLDLGRRTRAVQWAQLSDPPTSSAKPSTLSGTFRREKKKKTQNAYIQKPALFLGKRFHSASDIQERFSLRCCKCKGREKWQNRSSFWRKKAQRHMPLSWRKKG